MDQDTRERIKILNEKGKDFLLNITKSNFKNYEKIL
jgi:hypothetical protein